MLASRRGAAGRRRPRLDRGRSARLQLRSELPGARRRDSPLPARASAPLRIDPTTARPADPGLHPRRLGTPSRPPASPRQRPGRGSRRARSADLPPPLGIGPHRQPRLPGLTHRLPRTRRRWRSPRGTGGGRRARGPGGDPLARARQGPAARQLDRRRQAEGPAGRSSASTAFLAAARGARSSRR